MGCVAGNEGKVVCSLGVELWYCCWLDLFRVIAVEGCRMSAGYGAGFRRSCGVNCGECG